MAMPSRVQPRAVVGAVALAAMLVLAACSSAPAGGLLPTSTPPATEEGASGGGIVPPSPDGTRYTYDCEEGGTFSMLAYPAEMERATLFLDGETLELPQVRSGSGVRYSDGTVTLHTSGLEAFIEEDGEMTYAGCVGQSG